MIFIILSLHYVLVITIWRSYVGPSIAKLVSKAIWHSVIEFLLHGTIICNYRVQAKCQVYVAIFQLCADRQVSSVRTFSHTSDLLEHQTKDNSLECFAT
jgi:hypothetical protein